MAPAINLAYLATEADRRATLAGMRLARRIFAAPALTRWSKQETLPGPDVESDSALLDYARRKGVSGYHLVGTCRMGEDRDAVVDPMLRVRGLSGLRVADASILPTCTSGNTLAPTIMVAERCADMILAEAS
jgi:choline dehydrogenase